MLTDEQKARVLEVLAREFYLDNLRPAQEAIRASERHLLKESDAGVGIESLAFSNNERGDAAGMRMLPVRVLKRLVAIGKLSQQGKRVKDLFRLMKHPALWL